jgi:thioredoxin reductase (NADPH)
MPVETVHDCLIVGGGPAGLSAAIYMGRFLRNTVLFDAGEGRSSFAQVNENYLGFPDGVRVQTLRGLGRMQAERFGVQFFDSPVNRFDEPEDGKPFVAHTDKGAYFGKTVILCMGVCDIWPNLPDALDYVGRTLFWCITCDGFRTLNKRIVLFGENDEAATSAAQFLSYTDKITFLTRPGSLSCSPENLEILRKTPIQVVEGVAAGVTGTPDQIEAVVLEDGTRLEADLMFSLLGCIPTNKLALDLGVECDKEGYVKVDEEGYTSVPGVFCAGDLSRMHTHQVVAAAHEGAEAAQTANYFLYADLKKNLKDRDRALTLET